MVRAAIAALAVAVLAWLLWLGPLLAVRTVQVDGARTLPADQVRQAAGIETGTPLLRVDLASAEAGVAGLPQVAAVAVTRGWPDTVVITVRERVPVAVVEERGRRTLVDGGGVPFDTITGDAPEGLIAVHVPNFGPSDPTSAAALSAVRELSGDIRHRIGRLTATSPTDITLVLRDETTVLWGSAVRSDDKATVLAALTEQLDAGALDPAGTIDISAPDAVVLR
jgi:cell division protein FtsQ